MKKIMLLAVITLTVSSKAQVYIDRIGFTLESIADKDFGWIKIYNHPAPPTGKSSGNRTYSAKQIGYSQQFVEWMQQSYIPKGCLGDAGYYQNYIPAFSGSNSRLGNAINRNKQALPQLYGAFSKMYMFLKKDELGKIVPQNNFAEYWHIAANQLEYISNPVTFISGTEEYYFVLPDFNDHEKGYDEVDRAAANLMDFRNNKNIQAYRHFYIPPKVIGDASQYVVIMTRNHELPFEKITIGEFFEQAEKQFPFWQKTVPVSAENFALAQNNLARLKEKYKTKWNEIAKLKLSGTDISLYDFINAKAGTDDLFDNRDIYGKEGVYTTFPVFKVKKTAVALCKTDQPQWLVIRWTMSMPNEPYNHYLHKSILNNFNFDYVFNFFFYPEKVKGQPYKPLHSPVVKETVVVTEASAMAKKNLEDKNVFFFEDFSTTSIGEKPIGWQAKIANGGTTAVVKNPEGLEGNWVQLSGHDIKALQLKNPLPQNFTLSFDLVATQNFTWGAKGLTMLLSKETAPGNIESFLNLRLRPGFDGKDGEMVLETKFPAPPGYLNETKWYVAPGFSNNRKYNRISVAIIKKEESLQVFINKLKIAGYKNAIPATQLFNNLSFDCNGNSAANDTYYISDIKIIKDETTGFRNKQL
jgi:hypothetical protein